MAKRALACTWILLTTADVQGWALVGFDENINDKENRVSI